jgi:hypothetical protein
MADALNDRLSNIAQQGFSSSWDWKGSYVDSLGANGEEGYERFSQFSASPDSTMIFAGPSRFTGLSGGGIADLTPIGLVDNIAFQQNAQLMRLFEVGSNRSFFTRGKTTPVISFSKILADQKNILNSMSSAAYRPAMATDGQRAPGAEGSLAYFNLDSEYFAVPCGLLLVLKTRGGGGDGYGTVLSATYLENVMMEGYSFQITSQQPVIVENISAQYDRAVPVSFS